MIFLSESDNGNEPEGGIVPAATRILTRLLFAAMLESVARLVPPDALDAEWHATHFSCTMAFTCGNKATVGSAAVPPSGSPRTGTVGVAGWSVVCEPSVGVCVVVSFAGPLSVSFPDPVVESAEEHATAKMPNADANMYAAVNLLCLNMAAV